MEAKSLCQRFYAVCVCIGPVEERLSAHEDRPFIDITVGFGVLRSERALAWEQTEPCGLAVSPPCSSAVCESKGEI